MNLRLLAAAAGFLLLAACQTTGTGGEGFTKSDVLEGFGKAAYGWEFSTEPRKYIIRHGQPLRFLMAHETGDEDAIAAFKRVLGFIRSLHHAPEIAVVDYVDINSDTDLDFDSYNVIVLALGPANYEQIYEPMVKKYVARGRTDMADLFYFNRCFARVRENGGTIDKSLVLMDVDQVRNREAWRELDECMAEEILQGLGLPNDSDDLKWSIFNDRNGLIWPGNYDWLLLSMLYAPELRPGMNHEIAASRLPAILDRIWPAYQIRRKKSRSN